MKDTITRILLKIINILFMYNIRGTCLGCLVGIILLSLQPVLEIFFPVVGNIEWYGFIAFGVLLFNIKSLIKREYEDPRIEIQMKYLREMLKEGKLSDKEKRIYWREAIKCILDISSENVDKTNKEDSFSNNILT